MAKKRTPIEKEYFKQRKRLQAAIKREEKRGFIVSYELPSVPKKITKASVSRLKKITPKKIREKSYAINPETGEATSAQGAFVRSRWKTPEKEQKKAEALALQAKEIERKEAERKSEQFFPNEIDIVLNNYEDMMLSRVLPSDVIKEIKNILENPDFLSSVRRSYEARYKSQKGIDLLLKIINSIIANKKSNQVAMNIIKNGELQSLMSAIEATMYGSDAQEIELELNKAVSILTDNGKLTVTQFRDIAQTDDYLMGKTNE